MTESNDKTIIENYNKGWTCPVCKGISKEYPALSRRDNKTYICSQCGTNEAMEDHAQAQKKERLSKVIELTAKLEKKKKEVSAMLPKPAIFGIQSKTDTGSVFGCLVTENSDEPGEYIPISPCFEMTADELKGFKHVGKVVGE